jgi:hypothetical protein
MMTNDHSVPVMMTNDHSVPVRFASLRTKDMVPNVLSCIPPDTGK